MVKYDSKHQSLTERKHRFDLGNNGSGWGMCGDLLPNIMKVLQNERVRESLGNSTL